MTLPLSLLFSPSSLAASRLLSYANGRAIVWAKQPGIPLHKGEMEMEGERRERNRQKWGDAHQRPKTQSKDGFAARVQRARRWLSAAVYVGVLC